MMFDGVGMFNGVGMFDGDGDVVSWRWLLP